MFYGLYLGVHSIAKIEHGQQLLNSDKKARIIFYEDNDQQTEKGSNAFYYDYFVSGTSGQTPAPKFISVSLPLLLKHPPGNRSCYHPLFSRPPPAFLL